MFCRQSIKVPLTIQNEVLRGEGDVYFAIPCLLLFIQHIHKKVVVILASTILTAAMVRHKCSNRHLLMYRQLLSYITRSRSNASYPQCWHCSVQFAVLSNSPSYPIRRLSHVLDRINTVKALLANVLRQSSDEEMHFLSIQTTCPCLLQPSQSRRRGGKDWRHTSTYFLMKKIP